MCSSVRAKEIMGQEGHSYCHSSETGPSSFLEYAFLKFAFQVSFYLLGNDFCVHVSLSLPKNISKNMTDIVKLSS